MEDRIPRIAFQTGWESLGTFGRTFRDVTGESPSASRARWRDVAEELGRVPACLLGAALRPGLTVAVSELGLFVPGPPVHDADTAQLLREMVAKGAMPPLVLMVEDCRAAYQRLCAEGVEFIQEPIDRYGKVDAGFRDPSGNGWKMIQERSAR